jgi:recombination protein RecT
MSNEKQVTKTNSGLKSLINSDTIKKQFALALPKHMSTDRFVRVATTALMRVPNLTKCTPESFMKCLLDLSARGLEPDGRQAHLIPYRNNKTNTYECTLIVDYKGKVDIIMRSGDVQRIHADVVCENDEFEYDMGEIKKHKIDFRKPRGEVFAAYVMFEMTSGTRKYEVLSREEVEKVRQSSPGKNSPAWVNWWNEMARKTALHRGSKWLRLSPEIADALDEETLMSTVDIDAIDITANEPDNEPATDLDAIAAKFEENKPAGSPPFDDIPDPEPPTEEEVTRQISKQPSRSELNQILLNARKDAKWSQRQLDEEIARQFEGMKLADLTDEQVIAMIDIITNYYNQ